MKRMMILLICAALGLPHAYAQFTVGAKAGLNVASIGNVTVYPSNPLPGDLESWTLEYGYLPGAHVETCPVYREILACRPKWAEAV